MLIAHVQATIKLLEKETPEFIPF